MESQLTMLGMCLNQEHMYEALAALLRKTDDEYDRILCSQTEDNAKYLKPILRWLAVSAHPLASEEIAEIIALDSAFDPDFQPITSIHSYIIHVLGTLGTEFLQQEGPRESPKYVYLLTEHSIRYYLFSDRIKKGPAYQYSLREDNCHDTIALDFSLCLRRKRGDNILALGGDCRNIVQTALQAARVSGNSQAVQLLLEFAQTAAGSEIAPSDSGYASQRQTDSLCSPSIPDPGPQQDLHSENQAMNQAPGCCDEEAYPDDIRSIQSDNESIGSKISTTRSRAELFAVNYLTLFFAQLEALRSLHELALQKVERKRFIPNYRRILKSYYRRLLVEAASETEKEVTRVLRSRRNRESIAEGIADQLESVEENEQPWLEKVSAQPAEKQYLEDWLKRIHGVEYEKPSVASQEPLIDDYQSEGSGSDSGFDAESEIDGGDDFVNIDGAEKFLQQGSSFRNLVLDIRLLMLPHHLRQIVETSPKSSLQLIEHNDTSWINNTKAFLESYTGYIWDWWPLAPRIPNLGVGEQHLQWKVCFAN